MPRLIIGHVTAESAKIWVRGDKRFPHAFIAVESERNTHRKRKELEERHYFTGVLDVTGLSPATTYRVRVQFGDDPNEAPADRIEFGNCRGEFRTFPTSGTALNFMFGSCNLHSLGVFDGSNRAFKRLRQIRAEADPDFMIHCGDQIYYDLPNPLKLPSPDEYRARYLDAWGDARQARSFFDAQGRDPVVVHELMSSPISQLSKNRFDRYRSGDTIQSQEFGIKYVTKMHPSRYYSEHSNLMTVAVKDGEIACKIFRTKHNNPPEKRFSFKV